MESQLNLVRLASFDLAFGRDTLRPKQYLQLSPEPPPNPFHRGSCSVRLVVAGTLKCSQQLARTPLAAQLATCACKPATIRALRSPRPPPLAAPALSASVPPQQQELWEQPCP